MVLKTQRLRLVLESSEEILARVRLMPPEWRNEVSPEWLARITATKTPSPWTHGFRIEDLSGQAVGSCGFKGPPDPEGVLELAYGIDPPFQRKGYATETVKALTIFAFSFETVKRVRAHTVSTNEASRGVLRKCGFQLLGEVIEPNDGVVERWERGSPTNF
jgi:RimJ/RimL family protein N-acetyltransferase